VLLTMAAAVVRCSAVVVRASGAKCDHLERCRRCKERAGVSQRVAAVPPRYVEASPRRAVCILSGVVPLSHQMPGTCCDRRLNTFETSTSLTLHL
jgi:hypothetical protein